ncbi:MAG: lysophospholipid acyltransferase family protein [Coriobacteriales bacterium]|jgi:1-acyl-sn-glycerol-3-phosphate acyltransferase
MKSVDKYLDSQLSESSKPLRFLNWLGRTLVGTSMRLIFRAHYEGLEVFDNIPDGKGVIIAGNHSSYTDPMFIYDAIWPRRVRFMGKGVLFDNHKFLKWVLAWFGVFPTYTDARARTSIKRSISYIRAGDCVGIFPEGTRIKKRDKTGIPINNGVALIAKMADCLIVPVGIEGTLDISPTGSKWLHYPRVTLRFGQPVNWRDWSDLRSHELLDAVSDEVMRRVRCLEKGENPGPTPEREQQVAQDHGEELS